VGAVGALPERLGTRLVGEAGVVAAAWPSSAARSAARWWRPDRLRPSWTGDEGYRKAEVTGGGVDLAEVDPQTLESRKAPGLFLCGELLDAFGPIGGYNFCWAWATGRAAGHGAVAS
jgi:predicted flavoprotein YhiN